MNHYQRNCLYYWLSVAIFAACLTAAASRCAHAAGLKVCYKDIPTDATELRLYVGSSNAAQLLPGQTQVDGSVCTNLPTLPAPVLRGTPQSYTVRAANLLGEEGPASNALSFRYPTVPGACTLVSVGAFVP